MAKVTDPSEKLIARLVAGGMTEYDAPRMIVRQLNEGSASLNIDGDTLGLWARKLMAANPSDLIARLRDGYILASDRLSKVKAGEPSPPPPKRTIMIVGFEFPKLSTSYVLDAERDQQVLDYLKAHPEEYRERQRERIEDKLSIPLKEAQWAEFCRRAGLRQPGKGTKPRK